MASIVELRAGAGCAPDGIVAGAGSASGAPEEIGGAAGADAEGAVLAGPVSVLAAGLVAAGRFTGFAVVPVRVPGRSVPGAVLALGAEAGTDVVSVGAEITGSVGTAPGGGVVAGADSGGASCADAVVEGSARAAIAIALTRA